MRTRDAEARGEQLAAGPPAAPLRPLERVRVASFEKMSSEQIELARTPSRAHLVAGFLYLSRIVPGASTERRHALAKHFAEG